MKFAFYGRVSTEDHQDPASSRQWQLHRATGLIAPHGGVIVVGAEYFDIGQSRSIPWERRPAASALLERLKDPMRAFDAVVIGEPQRAFYGNQYSLIAPLFFHFGVGLWAPEVGGAIDRNSEAHGMMMALFGEMSRGERARIKIRVRASMEAQAENEGRYLGGRPPHGYLLADNGPNPSPRKAALGARLNRLEPDPTTAWVVRRIFDEYQAGRGFRSIAEGLTGDGVPSPSEHDPARNRHRSGRGWSQGAVRAILKNPRYTGHQVWGRQRREEVLRDVEDVAAGYDTKLRWNEATEWVWSKELAHEPLIAVEQFDAVQRLMAAGSHRPTMRKGARTARPYVYSGLIFHEACGRRMSGHRLRDETRYRCRYAAEYAAVNDLDHPKNVYIKEADVVPKVDAWLSGLFTAECADTVYAAMAAAAVDEGVFAREEAARRRVTDCDKRVTKYRSLLEAGTDPALVAGWIAEVQGERLRAEAELASLRPTAPPTAAEVRDLVDRLGGLTAVLAHADPESKARVYSELGLCLTYDHVRNLVVAEVQPWATARVGGGT